VFAAANSFADSHRADDYHAIKITGWSFYAAWGMSTMHHVTIENTSDTAYKDVRVKVDYYLSYYPTKSSVAMLVLPITIPPHSKKTYLERGSFQPDSESRWDVRHASYGWRHRGCGSHSCNNRDWSQV
jgi:hypothetical protein